MPPDAHPDAILLEAIEKASIGHRRRAKWLATARSEQLPPDGDWQVWLILAGRGWGKTRTGAEAVTRHALTHPQARIALVGPTAADVRDVMVEGESGILAISDKGQRPNFEPSKRRLTWPTGAQAALYSAEEPERLRGPQEDFGWCDELGAWQNQQATWDQLQFGLRLGTNPRVIVTTTPKPTALIRKLAADPKVHVTRGRTSDNAANLAPSVIARLHERYGGTRLGRQELDGELLEDVPGALWSRAMIERARLEGPVPALRRVVVGVDPSGSDGSSGDSQGMVVAGVGFDGRGYVLHDGTDRLSPDGWASKTVSLYRKYNADRVVAERNFGGAMVGSVLRAVAPNLPITLVTASRGKAVRAEPIAALYEQGKISHVEPFPELEDQLVLMTPGGYAGGGSPDRLDALVWALTDLMVSEDRPFDLATFMRANGMSEADIAEEMVFRSAQAGAA